MLVLLRYVHIGIQQWHTEIGCAHLGDHGILQMLQQ